MATLTTGNDILRGNAGNDTLLGNDGSDTTQSDADSLYGGAGNDSVAGDAGNDVIYGGIGIADSADAADTLRGGIGDDVIYGNAGDDEVTGNNGADTVYGGLGNDLVYGGNDSVGAGDSADVLYGNTGSDTIHGGAGDDTIYGGKGIADATDGSDVIYGGDGNDLIYGNAGSDSIVGGAGDDTLYAGIGADTLVGGDGVDTFFISDTGANTDATGDEAVGTSSARVQALIGRPSISDFSSNDRLEILSGGTSSFSQLSVVQQGSNVQVTLSSGFVLNILNFSASNLSSGNVVFTAPAPATPTPPPTTTTPPTSTGGGGTAGGTALSTLSAYEAANTLYVSGEARGSSFIVNLNTNLATDDGVAIVIASGSISNARNVDATGVTDAGLNLTAADGANAVIAQGTALADTLTGGDGQDSLVGNNGADSITAGNGTDTIKGGAGADTLTGGNQADTFFNDGSTEGIDIITDFAGTTDIISSALAASAFTYYPSTFRMVDNATNSHGFQFTNAAGTTNTTGMHQQDFDVTNAGAGGGKFMSETDNSGNLTGSATGDLLVLGGTTSGKTVNAGAGNDRIIDTTTHANIINGEGGNDTMSGSDGAETFTGGADQDVFVSTFGNASNDGLDIITDFTGADDAISAGINASAMTYLSGTNALVSVADNAQGFRFAASGGGDNGTGLDDVNFNESIEGGANRGKVMSMRDNSSGLTGSADGDFLYFAGTTASKAIDGGAGADRLLSDAAGANTLSGGDGDDTITSAAGNDTLVGGTGNDSLVGGAGDDVFHFSGGTGTAGTVARITTLGLDAISGFSNAGQNDTVSLAAADFNLGVGALTNDDTYIESAVALTGVGQDYSVGADTGLGILAISSGGNVLLYFTTNVEAATTANSVQFATLQTVALGDISAADFVGA